MATKPGSLVTYNKELPFIKFSMKIFFVLSYYNFIFSFDIEF